MSDNQQSKEETRNLILKLDFKTDADIIWQLAIQDDTQGYLKRLIRDDITRKSKKKTSEKSIEEIRDMEKSFNAMLGVIREAASKKEK